MSTYPSLRQLNILGTSLTQHSIKKDMKVKRAMVIQKKNEICQEFYFSYPLTKLKPNL